MLLISAAISGHNVPLTFGKIIFIYLPRQQVLYQHTQVSSYLLFGVNLHYQMGKIKLKTSCMYNFEKQNLNHSGSNF